MALRQPDVASVVERDADQVDQHVRDAQQPDHRILQHRGAASAIAPSAGFAAPGAAPAGRYASCLLKAIPLRGAFLSVVMGNQMSDAMLIIPGASIAACQPHQWAAVKALTEVG